MSATETKQSPIRLDFQSETKVIVTPEDQDRFVTTSADAALACRALDDVNTWKRDHFEKMLAYVHDWCREREELISGCYLVISEHGLRICITTPGQEYQDDLDGPISELDMGLSRKYPACPTICIQVPDSPQDSLRSFFSADSAVEIYGERAKPQGTG